MANIASARKRARQDVKRNAHNTALRSRYRTAIKAVRKAIEAGDKVKAQAQLSASQGVIAKIFPQEYSSPLHQPFICCRQGDSLSIRRTLIGPATL